MKNDRVDRLLNHCAIQFFRETGDGDYIAARLAFRSQLIQQFLWMSLISIEKYLKCILVLNRIKAGKTHALRTLMKDFRAAKKFEMRLSPQTLEFFDYLDTYGPHRYFQASYISKGNELFALDRAVWEVRRYARPMDHSTKTSAGNVVQLLEHELAAMECAEQKAPQAFRIIDGRLEKIIAQKSHPARAGLIWHNAFYGKKRRKGVWHLEKLQLGNAPLFTYPEMVDEVCKYVYLGKEEIESYKDLAKRNGMSQLTNSPQTTSE